MMVNKLYKIPWEVKIVDWTYKFTKYMTSMIDCHMIEEKKQKEDDMNRKEDDMKQKEDDYSDCKYNLDDETFNDTVELSVHAPIKTTLQVIATEASFILENDIVPTGEKHKHFLPSITTAIERNFKESTEELLFTQIRTDGCGNNSKTPKKVMQSLINKYYNPATGKSIMTSDCGRYYYDLTDWLKTGKITVK